MKIALLLTGQLRTVDMVKFLHMNTIISKYDTDVYLGIDSDNSLQCEYKNKTTKTASEMIKQTIDYFNPIDYFILDQFEEEWLKITNRAKCDIYCTKILFRQYYTIHRVYELLLNHIIKTQTKYDLIIRLRFDQFIWTDESKDIVDLLYNYEKKTILYNKENMELLNIISKNKMITFNEIQDHAIYLFGFGDFEHYKYANDQFFYHTTSILTIMYNFYNHLLDLMESCINSNIGNKGALIECIFYAYILNNNIQHKKTNISGIFIRENN
jgi:hypothetical protein